MIGPNIGRVIEIPPHFGRDQLLAMIVPIDEIEKPITEIRNQTLLYSVAFLLFTLPLYDLGRRLDRSASQGPSSMARVQRRHLSDAG